MALAQTEKHNFNPSPDPRTPEKCDECGFGSRHPWHA